MTADTQYEATQVDQVRTLQASGDVAGFQAVVTQVRELAARGLVRIEFEHPETTTGNKFIDVLRYRRLE